jgi:hypothetical protein
MKEPPLIIANTVLSILAVDYPVDKVCCYVSDDGAAMLTFEALTETCLFARKWVPFCKKHKIEPRAPEWYFAQKIDYLREKVHPEFVRERRAMKVSSYDRLGSVTIWTLLIGFLFVHDSLDHSHKVPGSIGRGTWYATCERFLHGDNENDPAFPGQGRRFRVEGRYHCTRFL